MAVIQFNRKLSQASSNVDKKYLTLLGKLISPQNTGKLSIKEIIGFLKTIPGKYNKEEAIKAIANDIANPVINTLEEVGWLGAETYLKFDYLTVVKSLSKISNFKAVGLFYDLSQGGDEIQGKILIQALQTIKPPTPAAEPKKEQINKPVIEPKKDLPSQSVVEPKKESPKQPVVEPKKESPKQPVVEPKKEPIIQPVSDPKEDSAGQNILAKPTYSVDKDTFIKEQEMKLKKFVDAFNANMSDNNIREAFIKLFESSNNQEVQTDELMEHINKNWKNAQI